MEGVITILKNNLVCENSCFFIRPFLDIYSQRNSQKFISRRVQRFFSHYIYKDRELEAIYVPSLGGTDKSNKATSYTGITCGIQN